MHNAADVQLSITDIRVVLIPSILARTFDVYFVVDFLVIFASGLCLFLVDDVYNHVVDE